MMIMMIICTSHTTNNTNTDHATNHTNTTG